jgi:hypothetical protein
MISVVLIVLVYAESTAKQCLMRAKLVQFTSAILSFSLSFAQCWSIFDMFRELDMNPTRNLQVRVKVFDPFN